MLSRNTRIGLILFFIYLVLYSAFVFTNAWLPDAMNWQVFDGINLAVVSGFGLILGAFLMALLYGMLCTKEFTPPSPNARLAGGKQEGEQ